MSESTINDLGTKIVDAQFEIERVKGAQDKKFSMAGYDMTMGYNEMTIAQLMVVFAELRVLANPHRNVYKMGVREMKMTMNFLDFLQFLNLEITPRRLVESTGSE